MGLHSRRVLCIQYRAPQSSDKSCTAGCNRSAPSRQASSRVRTVFLRTVRHLSITSWLPSKSYLHSDMHDKISAFSNLVEARLKDPILHRELDHTLEPPSIMSSKRSLFQPSRITVQSSITFKNMNVQAVNAPAIPSKS